ncbi:MAG: SLOG family protein [Bacteroidota bacterium]
MKILITGSRSIEESEENLQVLFELIEQVGTPSLLLHGGARGVDRLAAILAAQNNWKEEVILPDYTRYHVKEAPLKRNTLLVEKAEAIIAFYAKERFRKGGTWDTVQKATKANKLVLEYKADGMLYWTRPALTLF